MEQNQVYTVSIHPRGSECDLSRAPSPVVFSSRSKAYDFKRKADKLIRESGRNFYTAFQESTMDYMGALPEALRSHYNNCETQRQSVFARP